MLLCAAADAGASWRGNAGLQIRGIISDNLRLSADAEEPGGIIQVRPYVSSSRSGTRVQARFNYGPSALWYPGNDDLNRVLHTLGARASMELIERYFFLDLGANANQALVDPRVNSGFNAVGNVEAFTQRLSFTVRPRIVLPVLAGRFASLRITPGLGFNFTEDSADRGGGLRTGTSDTRAEILSGPMFTKIPWSVIWRRQLFDTDTRAGTGTLATRVGYVFSPKYRLNLLLGYDEGTNAFRGRNGESRGLRWETTFRWTPSRRAGFSFGVGERYFGNTYRFRGQYRHKRWVFHSDYDVSIESATTELEQQEVVPVRDLFGNPIEDPFNRGDVLTTSVTTATLVDDTFLRDRFTLLSEYAKGRNRGSLRWYVTRRQYDEADLDTFDNQVRLSYSRTLSARLSASAIINFWSHSEDNDAGFDYVQDAVDLVLNYRLGPRSSLGARIGRLNRDSEASDRDFSENRASLDFNIAF